MRKKASAEWWRAFERMQVVLRAAADAALDEVDRHKYHMSGSVSLYVVNKFKHSIIIIGIKLTLSHICLL